MKKFITLLICSVFAYAGNIHAQNNTYPWPQTGRVGIGTDSILKINPSSTLFPNATPLSEFRTGFSATVPYSELVTLRHSGINSSLLTRQLGLLLKLSDESTANESSKAGGMILESAETYANNPKLSFLTGNIRRMTLDNNGYVGIGTVTPAASLDVAGLIQISGTSSTTPPSGVTYGLFPYSGTGLGLYSGATSAYQGMAFWMNPGGVKTEVMRITSQGNVGIGVQMPNNRLSVKGSTFGLGYFKRTGIGGAGFTLENSDSVTINVGLGYGTKRNFFAGSIDASDNFFQVVGGTNGHMNVKADAKIGWSPSASDVNSYVPDTHFYRQSAGNIRTPGKLVLDGAVGAPTTTMGSALQVGFSSTSSPFSDFATQMIVAKPGPLGNNAGDYSYISEHQQTSTGNLNRLQTALYRRAAGTTWQGVEYRIQYAVDNSFTKGTKAYIAIGGSDPGNPIGGFISLATNGTDRLSINDAGYVGIGTTAPKEALSVNGNIRAKQMKVDMDNWPDFVFKPGYNLSSLADLKAYIAKNQHLPEVPTAAEIEKEGQNLGEINKLLVKKVEELTLYLIQKDEEGKKDREQLQKQQQQLDALAKKLDALLNKTEK